MGELPEPAFADVLDAARQIRPYLSPTPLRRYPALDRSRVEFVVLSEGERGLLGVGYTPARVLAVATAGEAPAEAEPRPGETELERHVSELVTRVTGAMGLRCSVQVHDPETSSRTRVDLGQVRRQRRA